MRAEVRCQTARRAVERARAPDRGRTRTQDASPPAGEGPSARAAAREAADRDRRATRERRVRSRRGALHGVSSVTMRYTMSRQRIEHTATSSAEPAAVYALLRAGATWPVWGPLDSFELERPGEDEPEGLGAVRLFRSGRVTGRDTIAELVE